VTLDHATADLLKAISDALEGLARWPAPAVRSALGRVLAGQDDPAAAADWLREFLAQREATR
jgi:hypothetical protein